MSWSSTRTRQGGRTHAARIDSWSPVPAIKTLKCVGSFGSMAAGERDAPERRGWPRRPTLGRSGCLADHCAVLLKLS